MWERLIFTSAPDDKMLLLGHYFATQPDPERGCALAILAGASRFTPVRPAVIRGLIAERVDPVLFALSHAHVGDLTETVALLWPNRSDADRPLRLSDLVQSLEIAPRAALPHLIAGWLDRLDPSTRLTLLKLVTGAPRNEVPAPLLRSALARWGGVAVEEIEQVWHGLTPPYTTLFAWLERRGPRPDPVGAPLFYAPMPARPLQEAELAGLDPRVWRAEWKWDGVRVQLVSTVGGTRLYSRASEDLSARFPELVRGVGCHAVIDGELLVVRDGVTAPFSELRQRLNRKSATPAVIARFPTLIRAFDLLFQDGEDLRPLPHDQRRARLEAWLARQPLPGIDLAPRAPFRNVSELASLRDNPPEPGIEGLMLKRADSPYAVDATPGWCHWQRGPRVIAAVLLYAERGGELTFGVWLGDALVPVGKAPPGLPDAEQRWLDQWLRAHTVNRFGPVREVEKTMVLEIAFDAVHASSRHKSGLLLRHPRILRIRADKPAEEADRLDTLTALLPLPA